MRNVGFALMVVAVLGSLGYGFGLFLQQVAADLDQKTQSQEFIERMGE